MEWTASQVADDLLTNLQTMLNSPSKLRTLLIGLRLVKHEYQSLAIQSEGTRWLLPLLCLVVLHSEKKTSIARFEVSTALMLRILVFWYVWLYSVSVTYHKVSLSNLWPTHCWRWRCCVCLKCWTCFVVHYTVKHPRRPETSISHSCVCVQQVVKYEFNEKLAVRKL